MNKKNSYCQQCQQEVLYHLKEVRTEVHRLNDGKLVEYQRLIPVRPICQHVMPTMDEVMTENLRRLRAVIV